MRLHRFYTTEKISNSVIKIENDTLIHQWRHVFRYIVGAQVIVFNGDGYDYLCLISEIYNHTATLNVVSKKNSIMPTRKISLVMALVKKDTFEWIVEKATELGVQIIIPLIAERSEKKSLRMDRLEKIAIEAAEQSGRGDVPEILEPVSVREFLKSEYVKIYDKNIIFHTEATPETKNIDQKNSSKNTPHEEDKSSLVCIGPEGGWSDEEVALFRASGFIIGSLGKLVLRAETAAIVSLAREN